MRHFRRLMILIICVLMLTTLVYAAGTTKNYRNTTTITATGMCSINLTLTISLDEPADHLTFPLPKDARNVTVNGTTVRTYDSSGGSTILADLSDLDGITGDCTLNISYNLGSVLQTVEKKLMLELPILSGFEYPVQYLEFYITFPGEISGNPTFTSSYLKNSVESCINWNIGGTMITGATTAPLQDRETLTLSMQVSEDLFPGQLIIIREGNPEVAYMAICAAVALLYWILMMRCLPILHEDSTTPPEGITAGEIGSRLSAAGVDLTMMVFSWAQMGYLRIHPDKYGRVRLEKRMDMGNERTDFEMRCFNALFRRSDTVEGTGDSYARLCRKVAQTVSGAHEMYRRKAGNIRLFRIISCSISLFCGICFGMNLALRPTWQTVWSVVFATLGVILAWGIQGGMYRFHIRGKTSQLIGAACSLIWILLGLYAGVVWIAVAAVAWQMLAGFAAAYGGRRSKLGRSHASRILGLRRYLKRVDREELERISDLNPDYFFDMLPFAMALGVDRRFARQFSHMDIPPCSYVKASERRRNAEDWALLMRRTADKMDKKQRKMQLEKWTVIRLNFLKRIRIEVDPPRQTRRPRR